MMAVQIGRRRFSRLFLKKIRALFLFALLILVMVLPFWRVYQKSGENESFYWTATAKFRSMGLRLSGKKRRPSMVFWGFDATVPILGGEFLLQRSCVMRFCSSSTIIYMIPTAHSKFSAESIGRKCSQIFQ